MEEFKKKSIFELKKLSLKEVEDYYLSLREYEYKNDVPITGIEEKKRIHKLLLELVKLDRILTKEKITIIGDKRVSSDKPKLYTCTHIGGNDAQRTFEAIKDHAYLFLGDSKEIYRDLTGLLLHFNGVISVDTSNKKDRNIGYNRALELLKKNGSLVIYPEGAWNISPNLPVMKLYNGVIKMAIETGAEIVPMAIEQYDNNFVVNIGQNYNIDESLDVKDLTTELRDKLATLKWDIWQTRDVSIRKNITESVDEFKENIVSKCPYGFTVQDVYDTMYKDKNEVSYDEVFSFQKKISR